MTTDPFAHPDDQETLEITADPEAMASLARSRREAAEGQLVPLHRP